MSELLTFPEMRDRYQNQWLLILCQETDRGFNLISGQVLAHSENRDEIYDAIETLHPKGTISIEYTGELPDNWAVIL
jgi:hypothetical protein